MGEGRGASLILPAPPKPMDSEHWISRLAAAKRFYAAQLGHAGASTSLSLSLLLGFVRFLPFAVRCGGCLMGGFFFSDYLVWFCWVQIERGWRRWTWTRR